MLADVAALPSTRVLQIEHHNDGTTTLSLSRPNISLSVPTDELHDIDRVLFRLRQARHDRFAISGLFLQEVSRKTRNLRWAEMLSKAAVTDNREQPPVPTKRRGRRKKSEGANAV